MPILPRVFAVLAGQLLEDERFGMAEAGQRTVVNRSYLAALMDAALRLEPEQAAPFPENHRFYGAVAEALGNALGSGSRDKLETLRAYRKNADYELTTSLPDWMPQQAHRLSLTLLDLFEEKFR